MSAQIYAIDNAALALSAPSAPPPNSGLSHSLSSVVQRLDEGPEAELVRHSLLALTNFLSESRVAEAGISSGELICDGELIPSIGERALALADRIEAADFGGIYQETEEALASISFALKHEVRRALALDLSSPAPEQLAAYHGRLAQAYNILVNCFHQSIIMLARSIDPEFDDRELSNDAGNRLEQTMRLKEALSSLIEAVKEAVRGHYPQSAVTAVAELDAFRAGAMRLLMRRDWEAFDKFADEIISTRTQEEFQVVAKKFVTYLEALFSHVQMRAVLSEQSGQTGQARAFDLRALRSRTFWSALMALVLLACGLQLFLTMSGAREAQEPAQVAEATTEAAQGEIFEVAEAAAPARAYAATPAPTAAEQAGTLTVQLAAYGNETAANKAAAAFRAVGLEARVLRAIAQGKGTVYRVQSGMFETRKEAARFGDKLKASGLIRSYLIADHG